MQTRISEKMDRDDETRVLPVAVALLFTLSAAPPIFAQSSPSASEGPSEHGTDPPADAGSRGGPPESEPSSTADDVPFQLRAIKIGGGPGLTTGSDFYLNNQRGFSLTIGTDFYLSRRQFVGLDVYWWSNWEMCDYCDNSDKVFAQLHWTPLLLASRYAHSGLEVGGVAGSRTDDLRQTSGEPGPPNDERQSGPFVGALIGASGSFTPIEGVGIGLEIAAVPALWFATIRRTIPEREGQTSARFTFLATAALVFEFGGPRAPQF